EAHLPAQRTASCQEPRLPAPHVHASRTQHPEGPAPQGSRPPVGL
ncbi:MAG: LSU ribosomal protein L34p, partial [uncultured Acidimicrobiales bacterium]